MEVMDAIYRRRSVRAYTDQPVESSVIKTLLQAAVQAPSAMNMQPWAFAVIQDKALLKQYSERAKKYLFMTREIEEAGEEPKKMLSDPDYNIFYNAGSLIIICARAEKEWNAAEDCCLAAQNLMLAACAMGLGTCPIGFARPWLSLPETRKEIGIPEDYVPVFAVIVGHPLEHIPPVPRDEPHIFAWK